MFGFPLEFFKNLLTRFTLTWHIRVILEEVPSIEKISQSLASEQASGVFSWLVIDVVRPSPLWVASCWSGSPGFYEKASWANHKKQASEKFPIMLSASSPVSKFLPEVPALTSLSEGHISCRVKQILLSLRSFDHGVLHQQWKH